MDQSHIQDESDERIVEIVRTQDRNAYAHLISRYQEKLLRYALYLCGDSEGSKDIVQESFIRAYQNMHSFDTKRKFSTWIYRITHNTAMTDMRSKKYHISTDEILDLADDHEDIEDAYIRKEQKKWIQTCITRVPIEYREPLILYFLEEKTYEEISDILRLPMGTVSTRLHRAKGLIKSICQKK